MDASNDSGEAMQTTSAPVETAFPYRPHPGTPTTGRPDHSTNDEDVTCRERGRGAQDSSLPLWCFQLGRVPEGLRTLFDNLRVVEIGQRPTPFCQLDCCSGPRILQGPQ